MKLLGQRKVTLVNTGLHWMLRCAICFNTFIYSSLVTALYWPGLLGFKWHLFIFVTH